MSADPAAPYSLLAELTYRCPLGCAYCSNPVEVASREAELDAADWLRVLDEARALGVAQVHFSGGEPLLRPDLEALILGCVRRELYPFVVTGGTLATEARLASLRAAGLRAIQVSLQDAEPGANDALAGQASFTRKREAVRQARLLGLHVTLNVVLHRHNLDHVAALIDLASGWGVPRVELAHAQYVGWALANRGWLLPTREQVERAQAVIDTARARRPDLEIVHVKADYFGGEAKACLHGWGSVFLAVTPDGYVLPCQGARAIAGLRFANVRRTSLAEAWRSDAFERFRGTAWMQEPCRSCARRDVDFGGCRCQAFLLTGDAAAADPACRLSPHHGVIAEARTERRDTAPLARRVPRLAEKLLRYP